ncbi:MAG: type I restriction enzyme HsdR N-terminal domain-containing protein [Alistipes sp.]|nr:type I restriction enzyme HsdR N-terminal domain-containing protein [Alistipes sp.]
MKRYPKLNLPPCRLRIDRDACGEVRVWDDVRAVWLVLTPEEWVRRHECGYLTGRAGVPAVCIVQEYPVQVSGMPQRADIVVHDRKGRPLLLVECKSVDIRPDNTVYAQAVRYNAVVGANYIMITNGLSHFVFSRSPDGEYTRCPDFPDLSGYFKV